MLSPDLAVWDIGMTTPTGVAARTRRIARVTELPMLADMTEFGTSDLFTASRCDLGVNMVISPVSLPRMGMRAAERALNTPATDRWSPNSTRCSTAATCTS